MLQLDGAQHVLGVGQGLDVPPGTTHQMHNLSDVEARFLVISAPHGRDDRTHDSTCEGRQLMTTRYLVLAMRKPDFPPMWCSRIWIFSLRCVRPGSSK